MWVLKNILKKKKFVLPGPRPVSVHLCHCLCHLSHPPKVLFLLLEFNNSNSTLVKFFYVLFIVLVKKCDFVVYFQVLKVKHSTGKLIFLWPTGQSSLLISTRFNICIHVFICVFVSHMHYVLYT